MASDVVGDAFGVAFAWGRRSKYGWSRREEKERNTVLLCDAGRVVAVECLENESLWTGKASDM